MNIKESIETWAAAKREPHVSSDFSDRVMARVRKVEAARRAARRSAARARLVGLLPQIAEAVALLATAIFYGSRLASMFLQVTGR